jgi:hypothetical protein
LPARLKCSANRRFWPQLYTATDESLREAANTELLKLLAPMSGLADAVSCQVAAAEPGCITAHLFVLHNASDPYSTTFSSTALLACVQQHWGRIPEPLRDAVRRQGLELLDLRCHASSREHGPSFVPFTEFVGTTVIRFFSQSVIMLWDVGEAPALASSVARAPGDDGGEPFLSTSELERMLERYDSEAPASSTPSVGSAQSLVTYLAGTLTAKSPSHASLALRILSQMLEDISSPPETMKEAFTGKKLVERFVLPLCVHLAFIHLLGVLPALGDSTGGLPFPEHVLAPLVTLDTAKQSQRLHLVRLSVSLLQHCVSFTASNENSSVDDADMLPINVPTSCPALRVALPMKAACGLALSLSKAAGLAVAREATMAQGLAFPRESAVLETIASSHSSEELVSLALLCLALLQLLLRQTTTSFAEEDRTARADLALQTLTALFSDGWALRHKLIVHEAARAAAITIRFALPFPQLCRLPPFGALVASLGAIVPLALKSWRLLTLDTVTTLMNVWGSLVQSAHHLPAQTKMQELTMPIVAAFVESRMHTAAAATLAAAIDAGVCLEDLVVWAAQPAREGFGGPLSPFFPVPAAVQSLLRPDQPTVDGYGALGIASKLSSTASLGFDLSSAEEADGASEAECFHLMRAFSNITRRSMAPAAMLLCKVFDSLLGDSVRIAGAAGVEGGPSASAVATGIAATQRRLAWAVRCIASLLEATRSSMSKPQALSTWRRQDARRHNSYLSPGTILPVIYDEAFPTHRVALTPSRRQSVGFGSEPTGGRPPKSPGSAVAMLSRAMDKAQQTLSLVRSSADESVSAASDLSSLLGTRPSSSSASSAALAPKNVVASQLEHSVDRLKLVINQISSIDPSSSGAKSAFDFSSLERALSQLEDVTDDQDGASDAAARYGSRNRVSLKNLAESSSRRLTKSVEAQVAIAEAVLQQVPTALGGGSSSGGGEGMRSAMISDASEVLAGGETFEAESSDLWGAVSEATVRVFRLMMMLRGRGSGLRFGDALAAEAAVSVADSAVDDAGICLDMFANLSFAPTAPSGASAVAAARATAAQVAAAEIAHRSLTASGWTASRESLERGLLSFMSEFRPLYVADRETGRLQSIRNKLSSYSSSPVRTTVSPLLTARTVSPSTEAVGTHRSFLQRTCDALSARHPHEVLELVVAKIVDNLRSCTDAKDRNLKVESHVVVLSIQLLSDLACSSSNPLTLNLGGSSSSGLSAIGRDLLKCQSLRQLLRLAPQEIIPVIRGHRMNRVRSALYLILTKLVLLHSGVTADSDELLTPESFLVAVALKEKMRQRAADVEAPLWATRRQDSWFDHRPAVAQEIHRISVTLPSTADGDDDIEDEDVQGVDPPANPFQLDDYEASSNEDIDIALKSLVTRGGRASHDQTEAAADAAKNLGFDSEVLQEVGGGGVGWLLALVRPIERTAGAVFRLLQAAMAAASRLGLVDADSVTSAKWAEHRELANRGMLASSQGDLTLLLGPAADMSILLSPFPPRDDVLSDSTARAAELMPLLNVALCHQIPTKIVQESSIQVSVSSEGVLYCSQGLYDCVSGWLSDLLGVFRAVENSGHMATTVKVVMKQLALIPAVAALIRDATMPVWCARLAVEFVTDRHDRLAALSQVPEAVQLFRVACSVAQTCCICARDFKARAKVAMARSGGADLENSPLWCQLANAAFCIFSVALPAMWVPFGTMRALGDGCETVYRMSVVRLVLRMGFQDLRGTPSLASPFVAAIEAASASLGDTLFYEESPNSSENALSVHSLLMRALDVVFSVGAGGRGFLTTRHAHQCLTSVYAILRPFVQASRLMQRARLVSSGRSSCPNRPRVRRARIEGESVLVAEVPPNPATIVRPCETEVSGLEELGALLLAAMQLRQQSPTLPRLLGEALARQLFNEHSTTPSIVLAPALFVGLFLFPSDVQGALARRWEGLSLGDAAKGRLVKALRVLVAYMEDCQSSGRTSLEKDETGFLSVVTGFTDIWRETRDS